MAQLVSVTPDKQIIVAGGDPISGRPGYIKFWRFDTGELIRKDPWSHFEMRTLLTSPDSRFIIVSGRDDHTYHDGTHYIQIGHIATGQYRTIKQGQEFPLDLAFTWDKKYLLFGAFLLDWRAGGRVLMRRASDPVIKTRGRMVLTKEYVLESTDEGFVVENSRTGEIAWKISAAHDNRIHRYSPRKVTPDGQYILAQKGNSYAKNAILVMWDLKTGELVKTFDNCKGSIASIDITADGQYAVVMAGIVNYAIKVLDIETGELVLSIDPGS